MKITHDTTTFLKALAITLLHTLSIGATHTVLLTGGAGFIGSHVAQELLRQGHTVIVVDNLNDAYAKHIKLHNLEQIHLTDSTGQLRVHIADIRDHDTLDTIFKTYMPDRVCHLAARAGVRASMLAPHEYVTSNIVGTMNLFELARTYNVPHVVYASSSSVYGNCGEGPFKEDFAVNNPISPYAMTKCACELIAHTYHYLYNINSTGLRFFTVYGPRGRMDMSPFIFMDALYNNETLHIFGDGNTQRDFTYIDDIVTGVVQALISPNGYQVCNLGRGEPITLQEFITTLEQVMNKKATICYEPMPLTDVLLTHADIEKTKKLLNYAPHISVADGLRTMYEWYLNEYQPLITKKDRNESAIRLITAPVKAAFVAPK